MTANKCKNDNHTRMNVSVRHCPNCGEIVNQKIKGVSCHSSSHAQKRKSGNHYCTDCGNNLRGAV